MHLFVLREKKQSSMLSRVQFEGQLLTAGKKKKKISLSIHLKPFVSPVLSRNHPSSTSTVKPLSLSLSPVFFLQPKPENAVTIAVSSRVLFRTEREQKVFEEKGVEEYLKYQIDHEHEPFAPGPAFPFVKVGVEGKYA